MNRIGPPGPLAAQAALRGSEPRLDDFVSALTEGRRRRRRRGARSAGAGAALAAAITVAVGLGGPGSTTARDEITFVEEQGADEAQDYTGEVTALPAPSAITAPAALTAPARSGVVGDSRGRSGTVEEPADEAATPRPRRAAARTKSTSLPRTCSGSSGWCLEAATQSRGKGYGFMLFSTMCVNATRGFGELGFATTQEVDFEILAGSRVIWRWSDRQSFRSEPHSLSALPGECYVWRTVWDQYDAAGSKVGTARLTLRVRSTAAQMAGTSGATKTFMTAAF